MKRGIKGKDTIKRRRGLASANSNYLPISIWYSWNLCPQYLMASLTASHSLISRPSSLRTLTMSFQASYSQWALLENMVWSIGKSICNHTLSNLRFYEVFSFLTSYYNYKAWSFLVVSKLKSGVFVATNWVKKTCQAHLFRIRHENGQNNGYRILFCAGDFLYRIF